MGLRERRAAKTAVRAIAERAEAKAELVESIGEAKAEEVSAAQQAKLALLKQRVENEALDARADVLKDGLEVLGSENVIIMHALLAAADACFAPELDGASGEALIAAFYAAFDGAMAEDEMAQHFRRGFDGSGADRDHVDAMVTNYRASLIRLDAMPKSMVELRERLGVPKPDA